MVNRGSVIVGTLFVCGILFLSSLYLSMPLLVRGTVLARHQDLVEDTLVENGVTVSVDALNLSQIHGANTSSVNISPLFGGTDEYAEAELDKAIQWFVNACCDYDIQEVYQGEGVSREGFGLFYFYDGGSIYWWFETDTTRYVLVLYIEIS